MWQKVGRLRNLKALEFEKWGEGSSLAAIQKFMPTTVSHRGRFYPVVGGALTGLIMSLAH